MAKQIRQAVVAAVVVFIAIKTGIRLEFLAADFAVKAAVYMTFATTLIGGVIGKMTSKGVDASAGNFGTKFATREAVAPRQLIYGKCRVGGTVVHMQTTGTDNYLLHMVVAIAGHEIEELTSVRVNDTDLTTSTSTISGSTVYTVTNSEYTNTDNDNNFGSGRLMRYTYKDGSQTAVDGFMDAQLSSMGASDKFLGVSYVYLQMVFDTQKFGGGIPAISFLVKGKKCYDPRSNSTAWTDNPALQIRDFLTNTQYGIKATSDEINDTTNAGGFASAANICDQNVTLADGSTTEKRYTSNGFTNFSANGNGVIESILSAMAGKVSYVNGKFNIFAGASQTPSLTITDDDLLDAVQIQTNPSSGNLFNSVKPLYVDSTQGYVAADAEVYQDTTMLNADTPSGESTANYVKQMESQLPFTVTDTMAQRLGRIALKSQRETTSISCLVDLKFMRLQPNDWVYVTNTRLDYSQKVFEVISTNMQVVTEGEVPVMATQLELKEVASSVFDFATSDYTTGQSEGGDVDTGDYTVTAPTNLALAQQTNKDGVTTKVDIKATWTNNSSDKVTLTEVAYKLSTDGAYTSDFTVGKGVSVALLPNVVVGKTYNVKARHIDVNGVSSSYTSVVNITIAAPTDAPAVPTSLNASTGQAFNIVVSWINSTSADLKATKIYRRTSNTTPTDDTYLVETIYGQNGKKTSTLFGTQDGLTAGTTYYFWARSVNHSDVHSAFTSVATGSFTNVDVGEIVDGAITTVKIAQDAVTNAKIAVDAIQGDVIAAGAITETKIGADAVTAAKMANDAVTADVVAAGAITTTKIADDAISTAKIAANAITASEIAAGSITSNEIAANTITAGQIAAGAISTDELAANSITSAKIAANQITASEIAAGTITATQIATDTITASNIAAGAIATDELAANAVTAAKITAGTITATQIASDTISANEIASNTITASEIASGTITATEIASNTITGDRINVDTLDVKHFANVSADIISHSGSTVPLAVFGSEFQRGSTNFTTNTNSTGTYLSMTIDEVRNNAQYQAIWTGVYGDCTNGVLEYSVNGGSTYTQAAGGIQNVTFAAGTFRTYVFAYSGTITGLATSGTNANKVFWRVRWITKLNSTYQSLYVFIDNTQ